MRIRIGYELSFQIPQPTDMLLMLYMHPSRVPTAITGDSVTLYPQIPIDTFIDSFGNQCGRIAAPAGTLTIRNDAIVEDSGLPDILPPENAVQHPVHELPHECIPFLLNSRYCEVDLMSEIAWNLFGKTQPGWPRVKAVVDFAHQHIEFGYGFARSTKTAMEAYGEKRGVCRDYMHLTIALLRALNIPARYATGYLGDIGVPPVPLPMDFSAWFEVYLSGQWWTLDTRHNAPRIGRVLMARGRDATDVALTTSFGPTPLTKFEVWTDEIK